MEEKDIKLDEELKENQEEATEETAEEATDEIVEEAGEETVEESEDDASTEDEEAEGKKLFGKKKDKAAKEIEKLKEEIASLKDIDLRRAAEWQNFRNRTEKEKTQMFETGAKSVIEKILPVVDNFERGLSTIPEDEKGKPFSEGMEMIYKQLMTELDKLEVKPIEALGVEFNPEFHNAVMQVESEEYDSGVIAQELQKGYTYRGQVVRHSMVAVVS